MNRAAAGLGLVVMALALRVGDVRAQGRIQASEKATLTQNIAGTVITVEYYRPSVRGRDSVFGNEVTWHEVWTPGANYATTIATSRPIRLNGHDVAPGRYALWIEVMQNADWIFHLHPDTTKFHLPPPPLSQMTMTFPITPQRADFRETLTWDFERVRATGAQLQMRWDHTLLAIDVAVDNGVRMTVDPATGSIYAGAWQSTPTYGRNPQPHPVEIRFDSASSRLLGRASFSGDPDDLTDFMLIPRAEGIFVIGFMMNGELAEADGTFYLEFTLQNGRPVSYEARGQNDRVFERAVRADAAPAPTAAPARRGGRRPR